MEVREKYEVENMEVQETYEVDGNNKNLMPNKDTAKRNVSYWGVLGRDHDRPS